MDFAKRKKHYKFLFLCFLLLLFTLIIITATFGIADISFMESIKIILSKIPLFNKMIKVTNVKSTHILIILNIRLPRIIMSGLIGIGLSIVGTCFQAMFKNPMADPYVLGISSGAALGATTGIILGITSSILGLSGTTIFAFLGAIITTLFVYNAARIGKKLPTNTLLLAGVTINFLLSSIISVLMLFNRNQLEDIVMWTMGSVSSASWKQISILLPFVLIGSLILLSFSKDLNIMLTGDDSAQSLGINVDFVKKIILLISSFIVAACVSVSGIIGFVGLIIPHIVRLLVGPDHRTLLPFSALSGAIFMILADTLARTLLAPTEIPVGIITSLFGAPYFLYLLIQNKKKVK
ncbi:FecCD family ABC transporter permease [Haloimpatiens sp. FM7330]|uniref:FecCD family ABC transporter permease n=1 Tax=Haloimpatiens sp. FM7330 TaxID=3298610 RepID=UPI003638A1E8